MDKSEYVAILERVTTDYARIHPQIVPAARSSARAAVEHTSRVAEYIERARAGDLSFFQTFEVLFLALKVFIWEILKSVFGKILSVILLLILFLASLYALRDVPGSIARAGQRVRIWNIDFALNSTILREIERGSHVFKRACLEQIYGTWLSLRYNYYTDAVGRAWRQIWYTRDRVLNWFFPSGLAWTLGVILTFLFLSFSDLPGTPSAGSTFSPQAIGISGRSQIASQWSAMTGGVQSMIWAPSPETILFTPGGRAREHQTAVFVKTEETTQTQTFTQVPEPTGEPAKDYWGPPEKEQPVSIGEETVWCRKCKQYHCCELPH